LIVLIVLMSMPQPFLYVRDQITSGHRNFRDMELYKSPAGGTTIDFISAGLKPGEQIYCNPPRDFDLVLGSNGLFRLRKLNAPL
jgi:hypothetical protein